jgi:[acyl-carrier-protein] S-malonyltransferase
MPPSPVVFMFPSQSSRYAGMIRKIVELKPLAGEILAEAGAVLGEDLSRYLADDPGVFKAKRDQRLGIFLVNHMYQRVLEAAGVEASLSLGFSLGEYNHLVHIGALSFAQALKILERPSPPDLPDPVGDRAVVYRIPIEPVAAIVERARAHGLIEIGGMLSPHLHHIVGETAPVRWACERLKEEQPESRSMFMPVKLPLHSSLMRPIGERLSWWLSENAEFQEPRLPYLPNALGRLVEKPSRETLIDLVGRHLYEPVYWRRSIDTILYRHRRPVFVEVGPRRALCAFFFHEKRWVPADRYYITDNMDGETGRHIERIVADLARRRRTHFASQRLGDRIGPA